MSKSDSEWMVAGLIVFFAMIVFAYHIGQLLWGIILIALVFWMLMLADCLRRGTDSFPGKGEYDKFIWSAALIFLNFIGAILYYYLVRKQDIIGEIS
ncbi:PLDc N-terminal domain-containing protein [Methanococcoides orientis]|uniref:PLDc N-terminal domain-containing protein n=1 Tax=Methanococcoides orientis TaxID=2822137 RepID=UPI001E3A5535|nr:PLDc N-terminal domain-containing protein [Methanococcoides orientis]UGV41328.1 PLDc N-terminal domain-containing protein [Methanococcoides orientis]